MLIITHGRNGRHNGERKPHDYISFRLLKTQNKGNFESYKYIILYAEIVEYIGKSFFNGCSELLLYFLLGMLTIQVFFNEELPLLVVIFLC